MVKNKKHFFMTWIFINLITMFNATFSLVFIDHGKMISGILLVLCIISMIGFLILYVREVKKNKKKEQEILQNWMDGGDK